MFFCLVFMANCCLAAQLIDKVEIIVNSNVITSSQIATAMTQAKQQLASSHTPLPNEKALRKQVINNLIDQEIQRQMVARAGIKISDSQLNQAVLNIAKQNHMSLAQLKQAVETSGTSYAKYRKNIKEQMAFTQLQQQELVKNINVTDREVDEFIRNYKNVPQPNAEYHMEDIFVPLTDTPSPKEIAAAKQRAEKLLKQIQAGTNFRQLAAAQSSGSNALKGGDLGWKKLAEMPTIFADSLKTMKPGQVVGPIQAPNGFHLIKLTGIRNSNQKLTKNQVQQLIFRRKYGEALQTWMQKLRAGAYVQYVGNE